MHTARLLGGGVSGGVQGCVCPGCVWWGVSRGVCVSGCDQGVLTRVCDQGVYTPWTQRHTPRPITTP